ncbi:MAG: LCP family protein [Eubacteriales bacterium]|nr:LCP family protein [Eubacteriales bacterium]
MKRPLLQNGMRLVLWLTILALLPVSAFAQSGNLPETHTTLPGSLNLNNKTLFRILLIGTDAYQADDVGRSDTMVLVQINMETAELKMVSFLRDLYVEIPGYGKNRLNAAYTFGDAPLLEQTLYDNFEITTDRYMAVNFSLLVELIDQIGGVSVDVSEQERIQLNSILKFYNGEIGDPENDQLLKKSGVQYLTGKQTLCYSRIRKIDSDFQRVDRQHRVIEALYSRVLALSAADLAAVIPIVIKEVKTDLTLQEALTLAVLTVQLKNVRWDTLTVPVTIGYDRKCVSGMDVLVPYLDKNIRDIKNFLW